MSKILISVEEISEHFKPLFGRLEKLEKDFSLQVVSDRVFSEKEASEFLKISTKKLQTLRNKREITFIREFMGRKVLYRYSHLIAFLQKNEIKAKK